MDKFEEITPNKTEYDLEKPNQFGISIGYDPYKYEVLMDSKQFLKGGDGGCNICGGLGLVLGYLSVATYYRDIRHNQKNNKSICQPIFHHPASAYYPNSHTMRPIYLLV